MRKNLEKIKEALQMTEYQEISKNSSSISGKTSPKRAAARSRPMTMSASPRTTSTPTMNMMTSPLPVRPDTDKNMKMRMSKILKIRENRNPSKEPHEY